MSESQRTADDRNSGPDAVAATAAPAAAVPDSRLLRSLSSREGALRAGGSLRRLVSESSGVQGLVGLHGGLPPAHTFPLTSLHFGLADGRSVALSPEVLAEAQQYSLSIAGYPPLLEWVQRHVAALHAPPAGPQLHRCVVTDGATHALEMVCGLFLDYGDALVTEEYTYPQALDCNLAPRGARVLPAAMDDRGLVPEALEELLAGMRRRGERMPKLLYTVPSGHNPTGVNTTLERKRAVYDICCRYNLLIVEDDPYFYLQFPPPRAQQGGAGAAPPPPPPGLAGLPHCSSYLSLDTEGCVVRIDSFAKFLAPGLRVGWVTAAPAVAEKLANTQQGQTMGPSGISQAITAELLGAWGEAGLEQHLAGMQAEYARRAAALHAAALRELEGLAEWREPSAGMFMWVRLLGVEEASDVMDALREERVVMVPGRICHPRAADPSFKCPFVRISYSQAPEEQLAEGVRRLGVVLRRRQRQRLQEEQQVAAQVGALKLGHTQHL